MWKLTIEDDQANKTLVHLVREDYGLGRAEDNAIRLTERNISRQHARLERSGSDWVLRDSSSYNGCYVNGQRVAERWDLSHGDLIQVGDYRLLVEDETVSAARGDNATLPAAPNAMGSAASANRLVMLVGPSPGAEFLLADGRLVIGRGEECDISVNHPSVSRVHAELHPLEEGRYELFDKESANGVRVNGVELPRSFVDAHDVIELGDVILKFVPAGETYVAGADESLQMAAVGAARRSEADEGHGSVFGSSLGLKLGLGVGVTLIAIAFVVAMVGRGAEPRALVSVPDQAGEQAARVMSEAKRLLERGDIRGAYRKASELAAESSARTSSDFRSIQAAYADHLFALAGAAVDPADKRTLYDQIARSPSVDAGRRKRALEELSALSAADVDVTDLPKAKQPASAGIVGLPSARIQAQPERPSVSAAGGAVMGASATRSGSAKVSAPSAVKPAAAKPAAPATLVRDNPFDTNR